MHVEALQWRVILVSLHVVCHRIVSGSVDMFNRRVPHALDW